MALTGNVSKAAETAKVTRTTPYAYRDEHPEFAAAWDEAEQVAADALELEARRRAHDGVNKPVIYKGELMGVWMDDQGRVVTENTSGAHKIPLTVKEYSDTLLIFLLKGLRPEKYRDNVKHDHSGRVSLDVTVEEVTAARQRAQDYRRERIGAASPEPAAG